MREVLAPASALPSHAPHVADGVLPDPTRLPKECARAHHFDEDYELSVGHLLGSASRIGAGVAESVRGLSQALACAGVHQVVIAPSDRHSADDAPAWSPVVVRCFEAWPPKQFGFSPSLYSLISHAHVSLFHVHGLWTANGVAAWFHLVRRGVPYILSPHGMLEPWALNHRRLKKRLVLHLWERRVLAGASCLLAASDQEAESLRALNLRNAIAVLPFGVALPEGPFSPRNADSSFYALFLSRIHVKKGLDLLLKAWANVRPAGWRLRIAGPDDGGQEAQMRALAAQLGLGADVEFCGPVYGDAKAQLFQACSLFILPTRSENFALVVTEALSYGIPVLTTHAAPWRVLEEKQCGWWVEPTVHGLESALRMAVSLGAQELRRMGSRGRDLVARRFAWPEISARMRSLYLWVAKRGPMPEDLWRFQPQP